MNEPHLKKLPFQPREIFSVSTEAEFEEMAVVLFQFQFETNVTYRRFCEMLGRSPDAVNNIRDIPFLPVSFFKTQSVRSFEGEPEIIFSSSGTSGEQSSKHEVFDLAVYRSSFRQGFRHFYGNPSDYIILGLLPSYLEREGSSLIYMTRQLIEDSANSKSGFFLNEYAELIRLVQNKKPEEKVLLLGVSYALLDLAAMRPIGFEDVIVMETGGMKGKRKELTKEQLHRELKEGLGVRQIHSEYGMTELLSQAYSQGEGIYQCPPWMKVMIREHNDPFSYTRKKAGGINVIDLANCFSCAFIATDDLGKHTGSGFEVLGRLDNADIRGCNLLLE